MSKKSYKIWTIVWLLAVFACFNLHAMEQKKCELEKTFRAFLVQSKVIEKEHVRGSWDSDAAEMLIVLYDQIVPCKKHQIETCFRHKAASNRFRWLFGVDITEAKQRINSARLGGTRLVSKADEHEPDELNNSGEKEPDETRELEEEQEYIVFEYEGETDKEPNSVFVPGSQEISELLPYIEPYEKRTQSDVRSANEDSSWRNQNPSPSTIPAGAGMTVTKNPRSNTYHWHDISDGIPDPCLPDPEKMG